MIESGTLIMGLIGILATFISGFTAWFFTRRKYNSEVDNNLIENMQDSLEFYKKLSDDNKDRLTEVLQKNRTLEAEIVELRKEVAELKALVGKYTTSLK